MPDEVLTKAADGFQPPVAPSQYILEGIGLTKSFGAFTAVNNVSLGVRNEEVLAIIGPNGAGKSTLFDLLTGRKSPDTGSVRLLGEDVTKQPPWRRVNRGLGRSFQVSSVFGSLTALENVQMGMILSRHNSRRLWGRATRTHRDEAETLLERVGLIEQRDALAGEFSHGDQRLLELAVTLSSKPKVLLLDEPTAGMGVEETDECLAVVSSIARAESLPVVFVEHDMKVVFSFASRVIVLVQGQVLLDGTPQHVRRDERVKEAYFGEEL